jgi:hypothetical protein
MKKTKAQYIEMSIKFTTVVVLVLNIVYFFYQKINNMPVTNGPLTAQLFALLGLIILTESLNKKHFLHLNQGFYIVTIIFNILAIILGAAFDFYAKYWWWDVMLHFSSGIILTFIGISIALILLPERLQKEINVIIIIIFGVMFAIVAGVFWEFYEFGMDILLHTNMQPSFYIDTVDVNTLYDESGRFIAPSLTDTMKDLFNDSMGAIIAGFISLLTYQNIFTKFYNNKE